MLGARTRRTSNKTRRDRRRIGLTILIVLVVALVLGEVIDDMVRSTPSAIRRGDRTWVAAAAAVIVQSNLEANELRTIRSRATTRAFFDRITLEVALEELQYEATMTESTYARLNLAAPGPQIGSLMDDVLKDRTAGIEALSSGINAAIGRPPNVGIAGASLAAAGTHLEAADAAYISMTRLVRRRGHDAAMPRSQWIGQQSNWSTSATSSFAASLARAPGLAPHPAIAIVAVSIEPPPLRITGLPASTTTTTTTMPKTTTTTTTTTPGASTSTSSTTTSTTTTTTTPAPTTTLQVPPSGSVSVVAATRKISVEVVVRDVGNTWLRSARLEALLVPTENRAARNRQAEALIAIPTLKPGGSVFLNVRRLSVPRPSTYLLLVTAVLASGQGERRSVTIDFSG